MITLLKRKLEDEKSSRSRRHLDMNAETAVALARVAGIVDPRNRQSIAKMKRHLGVRHADERAPFRVTLLGYCPAGATVFGRRRVIVPTSGPNVVAWTDIETVVSRLVSETPKG